MAFHHQMEIGKVFLSSTTFPTFPHQNCLSTHTHARVYAHTSQITGWMNVKNRYLSSCALKSGWPFSSFPYSSVFFLSYRIYSLYPLHNISNYPDDDQRGLERAWNGSHESKRERERQRGFFCRSKRAHNTGKREGKEEEERTTSR